MTASLPLLPADDYYDRPTSPRVRFQELAQVLAIASSYTVAGPRLWNNLPLTLRDSEHTGYLREVPPVTDEDPLVLLRTAVFLDAVFITIPVLNKMCHI